MTCENQLFLKVLVSILPSSLSCPDRVAYKRLACLGRDSADYRRLFWRAVPYSNTFEMVVLVVRTLFSTSDINRLA